MEARISGKIFFAVLVICLGVSTKGQAAWTTYPNASLGSTAEEALTINCDQFGYIIDPATFVPRSDNGRMVGYQTSCYLQSNPLFRTTVVTYPSCTSGSRGEPTATSGCVAATQPKQNGPQCPAAGNPFSIASGNKFEQVTDYASQGTNRLEFTRTYNSLQRFETLAGNPVASARAPMMGVNWRTNWDKTLYVYQATWIFLRRNDGAEFEYRKISGNWVSQSGDDVEYRITDSGTGSAQQFAVTTLDDTVETYNNAGRLMEVRYKNGYTQTLSYNASNQLETVTDNQGRALNFVFANGILETLTTPDNKIIKFSYAPLNSYGANPKKLTEVIYPDETPADLSDNPKVQYLYEDARLPQALTGIINERGIRFATWAYDDLGRTLSSEHAGGVEHESIVYNADGSRTVTNSLGKQAIYRFGTFETAPKVTLVEGQATSHCEAANHSYNYSTSSGYPTSKIDWRGIRTNYTYNSRGLQESRTEAVGTPQQRAVTTVWHPTFRVPTQITAPGKTTILTYTAGGLLETKTERDTTTHTEPYATSGQERVWTYGYNAQGLVQTINGPRTDVNDITTYGYDSQGNLTSITDAAGLVTQITQHDANGLPLTLVDPNGVTTTFDYDTRWRLRGVTTAGATRGFQYDAAGNLKRVTEADGSYLEYTFDGANRVESVTNNDGEKIEYLYDTMGNATGVTVKNAGGTIVQQQQKAYDELGRLIQNIRNAGTDVYDQDVNGNLVYMKNARNHVTTAAFDNLDRAFTRTEPTTAITQTGYDAQDNETSVTDARSHTISFVYNGFGEVIREISPDRGTTVHYRDSAGNITRTVDGRGTEHLYTYDALNRVRIERHGNPVEETITYRYDNPAIGANGKGRLRDVTDASGKTAQEYDARGNVVKSTRTIASRVYVTQYQYSLADNVTRLTYSSGRIVHYDRDDLGRINRVRTQANLASAIVTLSDNISYFPFGGVKSFTYGNGLVFTRGFDLDGRLTTQTVTDGATAVQDLDFGYDADDNLTSIIDAVQPSRNESMSYDSVNRLLTASGAYGALSYQYDLVGNMQVRDRNGGADPEAFTINPANNRLQSVTGLSGTRSFAYDGMGNTITDTAPGQSAKSLVYSARGRYAKFLSGGVEQRSYFYNAFGQRVIKRGKEQILRDRITDLDARLDALPAPDMLLAPTPPTLVGREVSLLREFIAGNDTHYHYGEDGELLGESADTGKLRFMIDYIWLGDLPLAKVDIANGGIVSYIHPDHLGTPRKMTAQNRAVVWDIVTDPFGRVVNLAPTARTLNPRFPGQYADAESGYSYNYFRDYDPRTGRYLQSDPIGLDGGINTFLYANANPFRYTDPTGENPLLYGALALAASAALNGGLDYGIQYYLNGGDTNCVNLGEVAFSAGLGAVPAGMIISNLYKATKNLGRAKQLDALLNAANAADRGGLTAAGRSLTKHAAGQRLGNTKFPKLSGDTQSINQQAQKIVDDITSNPGSTIINKQNSRFGRITEVVTPDGRGVVFNSEGKFIYFKE